MSHFNQFSPIPFLLLFPFLFIACGPDVSMEDFPTDPAFKVETLTTNIQGGTGGISIDTAGNIYVADFGARLDGPGEMGDKIFKVSPTGEVNVFAQGFKSASGNEFDDKGNLFQSNIGGNTIDKINPAGEISPFIVDGLSNPVGIAKDGKGNLFVCNCGNNTIQKISPDGKIHELSKSKLLKCPNGITKDDNDNLYVANFYNGAVLKISPNGETSELVTLPGKNNGHLIYHNQYLYVVARTANQIYKVSLDGKAALFAGSGKKGLSDGNALEASFCYPNDIGISPDGQFLYVNDVADTNSEGTMLAPMVVRKIWMEIPN